MKRIMLLFFLPIFFVILLFIVHAYKNLDKGAKFTPPDNKVLLIIGQDHQTIQNYLEAIGIIPAGFMIYTNIHYAEGLDSPSRDYGAGISYAQDLIDKYPNTVLQIGLYMVDALVDTYTGRYDESIDKFANWLKTINVPVYLRIGYEFDGPHNHYNPDDYRKAYRYIVDKFRSYGVNNVAYVWHAHAHSLRSPIEDWYPGDEYVDWVGISYFSQHHNYMIPAIKFAREHNKPVMIAEATPQGIGTTYGEKSWKRWFKPFFEFIEEYNIEAISYINSNWEAMPMWKGQGWGDARVHANTYIKEHWIEEIKKDRYLKSSKDLFSQLGYRP